MNIRLWINQNYERIRHWLVLVIGFILIVFAMVSYGNSNRLLDKVAKLSEQNKVLSQENKKLNQDSQKHSQETQSVVLQNRDNLNCLAEVFAKYTQDFVPVTIENLDKCVVRAGTSDSASQGTSSSASTQSNPSSAPSSSGGASGTSQGSSSASPSTNTTPPNTPPQSNNSQLDCKIDLLGLHIGCP